MRKQSPNGRLEPSIWALFACDRESWRTVCSSSCSGGFGINSYVHGPGIEGDLVVGRIVMKEIILFVAIVLSYMVLTGLAVKIIGEG